jgi:hypothetical protein
VQRIAQEVVKIEKLRDNLQEFAKGCGLYGFVEIVKNIEKNFNMKDKHNVNMIGNIQKTVQN